MLCTFLVLKCEDPVDPDILDVVIVSSQPDEPLSHVLLRLDSLRLQVQDVLSALGCTD